MSNYDDFISQICAVSQIPRNVYPKIRFRIVAGKIVLPATVVIPIFCIFAGIFLFNNKNYQQDFDITSTTELLLFAQNNNFYSLFDDQ
ncbi:MAG: hypothetical protein LBH98_03330 [Chitinispirillales bacterium]|jgi:hypothetical protein|nr:hypothetical protein [Chitinispirillales bacterium]